MRAAYLIEPRRVEIRDEAIPVAAPGGLVVRVRVALTDGTDLKTYFLCAGAPDVVPLLSERFGLRILPTPKRVSLKRKASI